MVAVEESVGCEGLSRGIASGESDGRDDYYDSVVVIISVGDGEFLSQFGEAYGLVSSFNAIGMDVRGVGASGSEDDW